MKKKIACFSIDVDCSIGDRIASSNEQISVNGRFILSGVETALPRYLELMADWNARSTLFIIANTIQTAEHKRILREALAAGHEIASHSVTHPKDLGLRSSEFVKNEIYTSKAKLEDITGKPVVGFRAPGYYLSSEMILQLRAAGYRYSSSVNSSLIYNTVKFLLAFKDKITKGSLDYPIELKSLLAPSRIYCPSSSNYYTSSPVLRDSLVEIPISNDPLRLLPAVMFAIDSLLPASLRRPFIKFILTQPMINFVFHDLEFLTEADFPDTAIPFAQGLSCRKFSQRKNLLRTMKENLTHHEFLPLVELVEQTFNERYAS